MWLYEIEVARGDKQLDPDYCRQIKSYFYYVWVNDIESLLCHQQYFYQLPITSQQRIGALVFRELLTNFDYFFAFFENEDFKIELLKNLKPRAYSIITDP